MSSRWFYSDDCWHRSAYGPIATCGAHARPDVMWVDSPPRGHVVCADCAD